MLEMLIEQSKSPVNKNSFYVYFVRPEDRTISSLTDVALKTNYNL